MKLQPDQFDTQSISGQGPGWVLVGAERIAASVVLGSHGERFDWNCERFADLTPEHFARLAEIDCEVVLFGSGLRNRFPPAAWLAPLVRRQIGLETMDTAAACRTYNILAGEGRHVVVALLLETAGAAG